MASILLVDDNVLNQFIAVKMLQRCGVEVKTAGNGVEALALMEKHHFQLVLMDLDMPLMDGFESTRKIREMEGAYFKTVPIIAFTASEIHDERTKALESGMTDLVGKPLQLDELQATIDKYVQKKIGKTKLRPINIEFDQYTEGDDGFKKELISLIVNDIKELQKVVVESASLNNAELFSKARHKSKTTISMLNDEEFSHLLEEVGLTIQGKGKKPGSLADKILLFNEITAAVMGSLSHLNEETKPEKG